MTAKTVRYIINFKNTECEGGIILNLDLNKAFDRVDHSFLKETLAQLGFGPKFLNWINIIQHI